MKPRLVLAGTLVAGLVVLLMPTATAAAPATTNIVITAVPSTTLIQTDTWFRVTGTVVHPNSPRILRLQQYMKRAWTNVGYAHMTTANTYKILASENQIGTDFFRVAIFKRNNLPKPNAAPLVVSPAFSVSVATWTLLENWNSVDGESNTGQVEINGAYYNQSLSFESESGNTGNVGFNLGKRCYALKAVAGIDDNSPTDALGEFTITTDGKTVFDGTLSFGQAAPISIDMSNVLRLELNVSFSDPNDEDYTMAYGNAEVFCS